MRRTILAIVAVVVATTACTTGGIDTKEAPVDEDFLLVQELEEYPQLLRSSLTSELFMERESGAVEGNGRTEGSYEEFEPASAWILHDWGPGASHVGGEATFARVFSFDGYAGPVDQSVFHYAGPEGPLKVIDAVRDALDECGEYTMAKYDWEPVEYSAEERPEIALGPDGVVFTAGSDNWHAYVADGNYLLAVYLGVTIGIPADEFIPRVAEKFHAGVRAQEG